MNVPIADRVEILAAIFKADAEHLFADLYGEAAPKSKLVLFSSKAVSCVKWSEVQRRPVCWGGVRVLDLVPLLRVNRVLMMRQVPSYVKTATILEELIHLKLGWEKENPHDKEFYDWAFRCPFFTQSSMWKDINVLRVVGLNQNFDPEQVTGG